MPTRLAQRAGRARPRVVIDTNVWISAWLSSSGTPAQVVRRAVTNAEIIFTDATFDELQTRVWRPKFDRYLSLERRRQLLHDAAAIAHWAAVPPALAQQTYCRDADDDPFIHAAVAGHAGWLVSGDQDLLALAGELPLPELTILSPDQALKVADFCLTRG